MDVREVVRKNRTMNPPDNPSPDDKRAQLEMKWCVRISKIFAENRSSGDARLKRERKAVCP